MKSPQFSAFISETEIENIRQQMLKFAKLQLRNNELAEDLVQESLCEALKNLEQFKRQAALKTWIFAILKNKIIDYLRKKDRLILASEIAPEEDSHTFFDHHGHWEEVYYPSEWGNLENAVYSQEFWLHFELCLNHLPAKQARVFMMREYLELDVNDICTELNIGKDHLYTLMYRARLQLQQCLSRQLGDRGKV